MELLRTGSRLSVQPVRPREFEIVLQLAEIAAGGNGAECSQEETSRREEGSVHFAGEKTSPQEGHPCQVSGLPPAESLRDSHADPLDWIDDELAELEGQGLSAQPLGARGPAAGAAECGRS